MPNKKKTVQQREQELAQKIMDDVNAGMDARFARFEQLFDRLAPPEAPVRPPLPPPDPAVTRSQKRAADQLPHTSPVPKAPRVSKPAAHNDLHELAHSSLNDSSNDTECRPSETPAMLQRQSKQATPFHPEERFAERPAAPRFAESLPASNVNTRHSNVLPDPIPRQKAYDNNNNYGTDTGITNSWAAWSTAHQNSAPSTLRLPTSTRDITYEEPLTTKSSKSWPTPFILWAKVIPNPTISLLNTFHVVLKRLKLL